MKAHEELAIVEITCPSASQIPTSSTMAASETWPTDAQGNRRFDVVWLFEFDTTAGTYRFSHIPQILFAGDLPE
jgi:hypothetical protein